MAFGERLTDILGDFGRGLVESLPAAGESFQRGFVSGRWPEVAMKRREAEAERQWKEEEQRRREEASMEQLEYRLLQEQLMKENILAQESALKRELASEAATQKEELTALEFRLDLAKEYLLKGTAKGRELGFLIAGPYAPLLKQWLEGQGLSTETPTAPSEPIPPTPITGAGLRARMVPETPALATEGGVPVTPTVGEPSVPRREIPELIAKEIKTPPMFAELEYGMNKVGMPAETQREVMTQYVGLLLRKKLSDPRYQVKGAPIVIGGLYFQDYKDDSRRMLTDRKGNPLHHMTITGSAEQGWWRTDEYIALQNPRDPRAVVNVVRPIDKSDPLSVRMKAAEDAINLWIPQAKTFKFGEGGKAMIPRGAWGKFKIPWGPPDKQGNIKQALIEDVIYDICRQYHIDVKSIYDPKDKHFKVAFLEDLAGKWKEQEPRVGTGRFKQEPPSAMPKGLAIEMRKKALDMAKGDKEKAREIFNDWARRSGYNIKKMVE